MAVTLAELRELRIFVERCKRLRSVDMNQLVAAGAMGPNDISAWQAFCSNPLRYLVRADDDVQQRIWRVVVEDGHA